MILKLKLDEGFLIIGEIEEIIYKYILEADVFKKGGNGKPLNKSAIPCAYSRLFFDAGNYTTATGRGIVEICVYKLGEPGIVYYTDKPVYVMSDNGKTTQAIYPDSP